MTTLIGTFMQAGVMNANGHIYDPEAMKVAFDEYKKKVDAGEAFGIIGDAERPTDTFDTNLSEISHRITEINYDELTGKVFGKIQLYDTPRGNIAQKLIDTYGSLDIAPSSFGEIEDGKVVKVSQFNSFDIVKESAWPDAKVKPITEE